MKLRILSREQSGEISRASWESLAQNALIKNPFYERWNLLPALEHLERSSEVELVSAWEDEKLVALFPIRYDLRLPFFTIASIWKHDECYCSSPLVTDERAWSELLPLLWQSRRVHMLINTTQIESALAPQETLHLTRQSYQRAALDCTQDYRTIEDEWPRKRRKEWRRLMRKACDEGDTQYRNESTRDGCLELFSQYQKIESAGWKGSAGTAISQHPNLQRYYESVIEMGASVGRVEVQLLEKGAIPLAASLRLIGAHKAFEVKTSYCERHRNLSPGVLLEILNMQHLAASDLTHADSCTQAGNKLLETLWPEKAPIYNSMYFARGPLGKIAWLASKAHAWIKHRNNAAPQKEQTQTDLAYS